MGGGRRGEFSTSPHTLLPVPSEAKKEQTQKRSSASSHETTKHLHLGSCIFFVFCCFFFLVFYCFMYFSTGASISYVPSLNMHSIKVLFGLIVLNLLITSF